MVNHRFSSNNIHNQRKKLAKKDHGERDVYAQNRAENVFHHRGGNYYDDEPSSGGHRSYNSHFVSSVNEGESEVEHLTRRIEQRDRDRLKVKSAVRNTMIKRCRDIQREKGYQTAKIHIRDMMKLRDEVKKNIKEEEERGTFFRSLFGDFYISDERRLLHLFNKAAEVLDETEENEWFHFVDFSMYYTQSELKFFILSDPIISSILLVLTFYAISPLIFCVMLHDEKICERNKLDEHGWMSAIFFASETLSTVGFGDLHVSYEKPLNALCAIAFMIVSNITLLSLLSTSRRYRSYSPFERLNRFIADLIVGSKTESHDLYQNISRLKLVRTSQIVAAFTFLNLVGAIVLRLHSWQFQSSGEQMSWILAFYWAVQTTTTIGYGDVPTPFEMRLFGTVYLIVSTYFVGRTIQSLANLQEEINSVKTMTVWKRRELSKGLVEELQPAGDVGEVDQYEFLVASLVTLKKISSDDVRPIMNKYRELMNEDGVISVRDAKSRSMKEDPDESIERSSSVGMFFQRMASLGKMRADSDSALGE